MSSLVRSLALTALSPALGLAFYHVIDLICPHRRALRLTMVMGVCGAWVCVAVWTALTLRGRLQRLTALAIGSGAVWCVALLIMFEPTDHGFRGYQEGDTHFLSALITKAYWYAWPVDSTYRGLAAHDPPLFFWILGKIARVIDLAPLAMRKWGVIAAYAQLVPLAYFAWRRLIGARAALVCALFNVLFQLHMGLFKPHELFAYVLFAPWWLTFVADDRLTVRRGLIGGFLGACLFSTFYYPFFVGALLLLWRTLWGSFRERRWRVGLSRGVSATLLSAVIFAGWFWLPLAIDFVRYPFKSLQNRWYHDGHLGFSDFQGHLSIGDTLLWFGVAALVLGWPDHRAQVRLRELAGAAGLWLAIAVLTTAFSAPLLFIRTWPLITALVTAAACIGLEAALRQLSLPHRRRRVALLLLVALVPASQRLLDFKDREDFKKTIELGREQPFRELQTPELMDKVILSTNETACNVTPAFCFVARNAHFSHPSGQFKGRVAFLKELVEEDARRFCHRLRHNPYDAIDYIYVDEDNFWVDVDNFPNQKRTVEIAIPDLSAMPCLAPARKIENGKLYAVKVAS